MCLLVKRSCSLVYVDKKVTRWSNFERYCLTVTPILEAISRNGLGIDPLAQREFFDVLIKERDEISAKIATAIPPSILKEKTWKRPPKVMDGVFLRNLDDGSKQWYRSIPFNPRSWQQIQQLAVSLGVKLPKKENAESDDDTSTSAKVLKRVAKKYPIFGDILKFKEPDKMITSYNWRLSADNRVHSTYGFHPSTWRKSCRAENVQVIPKSARHAKGFRRMIVPRPGNILIEGDSVGIEALLTGWLAGSTSLMRLAAAGIHDWTASAYHGQPIPLSLSDSDLKAACKEAKGRWPEEHDKFKKVVYASLYLATPRRIFEEHPEEFEREAEAAKLQAFFFDTEPGQDVRRWQQQTIRVAHANKGLENHFGLKHRFYSVYAFDKRRNDYVLGEDAKRAVAFVPQSDASFVQSDILLRLVERDIRFLEWLVAIVHDSIILDVPRDVADYSAAILRQEMVRPLAQLDGLWVGAELKKGDNLRDMEVIHAPVSATPVHAHPEPSAACPTPGQR